MTHCLPLLLILMLVAPAPALELIDETLTISPGHYETLFFAFAEETAFIHCSYEGNLNKPQQVVLVPEHHLSAFLAGEEVSAQRCGFGQPAAFQVRQGHYAIVVDNRTGSTPLTVHLKLTVQFVKHGGQFVVLPSSKRWLVILGGFLVAVLLGLVWGSLARQALSYAPQRTRLWPPWPG